MIIPFLPDYSDEKHELKNLFDDKLEVTATTKEPVTIPRGETLIWDHIYKEGEPGYLVRSGDKADIDSLRIYGSGNGAQIRTTLTMFFGDGTFTEYPAWTGTWSNGEFTAVSANDVLGKLKGKTVVWYRVTVTPVKGPDTIEVHRIDFFWEARDIEKMDCSLHDIIEIEGIGEAYAKKLRAFGIDTVEQLLHLGRTPELRKTIAGKTGLSAKRIDHWVNMSELYRINGVGEEYSELLDVGGIHSLSVLADSDPIELHKKLAAINEERNLVRKFPSELHLKQWVIQARNMDPLVVS